ncbi:MAG: hypothetical protein ACI90V_000532 [Bacillariaceae sp.]|jgi:hypothetical protein
MLSSYCTERYYKNIYLMKALVRDAVHKKKSYIGTRRRKIKSVKKLTNDRISLFSIDNGWIGFTSVDFLLAHAFSSSSFSRDTMIQY